MIIIIIKFSHYHKYVLVVVPVIEIATSRHQSLIILQLTHAIK